MTSKCVLPAVLLCVLVTAGLAAEDFDTIAASARLALDTGRLKQAEALFQKASALDPERAGEIGRDYGWVYVLWASEALQARNYPESADLYTRAAQLCPSLKDHIADQWSFAAAWAVDIGLNKARKSGAAADWDRVENDAKTLVTVKPDNPKSHYLLGFVYHHQNKSSQASTEYTLALAGKVPPGVDSLNKLSQAAWNESEKYRYKYKEIIPVHPLWKQAEPGDFQMIKKGRFKIYHHNKAMAERVGAALEYYLSLPVLAGFLTTKNVPSPDCEVYLYRNHEEYAATDRQFTRSGGRATTKNHLGTYRVDVITTYQMMFDMAQRSIPHELAHLRFYNSAYVRAREMKWLYEGVATSAEGPMCRKHTAERILRAAADGKLVPAKSLLEMTQLPKDDQTMRTVYDESRALVESVVDKCGIDKFRQLADAFYVPLGEDSKGELTDHDGRTIRTGEKFKEICGLSPRDLDSMILAWATRHAKDDLGEPATVARAQPRETKQEKSAPNAKKPAKKK